MIKVSGKNRKYRTRLTGLPFFFEINFPVSGNGSKMVEVILKDLPENWRPAVVMDWSDGFWDKMKERYGSGV